MIQAKCHFSHESEKTLYVRSCDARFDEEMDWGLRDILSDSSLRVLTLSGPSCSGKTTLAEKTVSRFAEIGRRVHVISLDDFFYERAELIRKAEGHSDRIDFDSPAAIDMEALSHAVEQIFAGNTVEIPTFDFKSGKRVRNRTLTPGENEVYLFEGIQAVYPQVVSLFSEHSYRSLYVSVESAISCPNGSFYPNEIRFLRRLVRDFHFRNASPAFTFHLWRSVRRNEEAHIFPNAVSCDVRLDSVFPCELSLLKPHAVMLLKMIEQGTPFYEEALGYLEKLSCVEPISRDYLAADSLYREFLG